MTRYFEWCRGAKAALQRTAGVVGLIALTSVATAAPTNPDPSTWSSDTGAIVLGHGSASFAVETFSISGGALPIFFGLYFDGTAGGGSGGDGRANAGIIFDSGDPVGNTAVIDFATGTVSDVEDSAVQSLFTVSPPGTGNIGFYIAVAFGGTCCTAFFTDPALNGGFDLAATFPAIADPTTYLIAFELPSGTGGFTDAYQIMITGLRSVPEPATWTLTGLGLILFAPFVGVLRSRRRTIG